MEQIKLEVGKTYLSRKGEEVRIVEKGREGKYLYKGSNDEWYTESGRWQDFSEEDPRDLIEEAPKTSRTFDIPNGAKKVTVSQEGNRIIVEMVPEDKEPKPGDVMVNNHGSVYIFKSHRDNGRSHASFAWLGENGALLTGGMSCYSGRPATAEEAQPLWDALKKAGKRWNAETMQVEDVPERKRIMDFLRSYLNDVKWSHEQLCILIESYIKYRGDKK